MIKKIMLALFINSSFLMAMEEIMQSPRLEALKKSNQAEEERRGEGVAVKRHTALQRRAILDKVREMKTLIQNVQDEDVKERLAQKSTEVEEFLTHEWSGSQALPKRRMSFGDSRSYNREQSSPLIIFPMLSPKDSSEESS